MRLLPIHFWSQNMSLRARDFSSSVVRRSKHHHWCRQWYLQRKGGKDQSLPPVPLYSPFLKQLLLKHCHCIQRHKIIASWFLLVSIFFFFLNQEQPKTLKEQNNTLFRWRTTDCLSFVYYQSITIRNRFIALTLFPNPPPQPHTHLPCYGSFCWHEKQGLQPEEASSDITQEQSRSSPGPLPAHKCSVKAILSDSYWALWWLRHWKQLPPPCLSTRPTMFYCASIPLKMPCCLLFNYQATYNTCIRNMFHA